MKTSQMSYPESMNYLYGLQRYGIRASLEVIRALSENLSRPHEQFPSIHIGGTNGKGSTAALLASILQAEGYRVGLYTSPHLLDFTERIRIDGQPILEETVAELTARIRHACGPDLHPTFFEFTTAMAFDYFARDGIDLAVVEVGMGGRLDATNILKSQVTVITNVDYDHELFLGNTLESIAREKAGIIRSGVPVVSAALQQAVRGVIENTCREQSSPLHWLDRDFHLKIHAGGNFDYIGCRWNLRNLDCALRGKHQIANAATALAALEQMEKTGWKVGEASIRAGLRAVSWEGRLQVVRERPRILLDGAHNPAGARALAGFLKTIQSSGKGRFHLMIGMLADKNISGILNELTPVCDAIIVTQPDYSGSVSPDRLMEELEYFPGPLCSEPDIPAAMAYTLDRIPAEDTLCVTGSLYMVGAAKAWLEGAKAPLVFRG